MMTISIKGLRSTIRGILWQIACPLIWWYGRKETQIFWDRWKTIEYIWDLMYLYSSFWAPNNYHFEGDSSQCNSTQLELCV